MNRKPFAGFSGTYVYVRGRQLEGTYSDDPSIGMWGISACRVVRGWGNAPRDLFPVPETWPPEEPEGLDEAAKENRVLTYQRVRCAGEAIKLLSTPNAVSASFEITKQWFDAPGGVVTVPEANEEIIGAHAVAIVGFRPEDETFQFVNSWGTEWGDFGFGYLPLQYFDRHFQESWVIRGIHDVIPVTDRSATQLVEWGLPDAITDSLTHLVEMYDPRYDERMGWAIAVERSGFLEIEDLFVKPQYRQQGIGSRFCSALAQRGRSLGMPLRLWISHADARNLHTAVF
ncbi:MAG: GNAT family N-acetyltransferase, partial [Planctomycetaceae bacterium]|nr:GNAT family N-acetyltransferase [Planctomycetaceae bacterium]